MKILKFYLIIPVILCALYSCKKTIGFDAQPKNRITEFKVVNLPDTVIYGVIDDIENSITIYVPYYYGMNVIEPKITLDPNATLAENVVPVGTEDKQVKYTVKSADGQLRTYQLIIKQQNTASLSLKWNSANPLGYPGESMPVVLGNFLSTSTASLMITFTHNQTGQKVLPDLTSTKVSTANPDFGDTYILSQTLPVDLDSGYYQVDIGFLGHQVRLDKPMHIVYPEPEVAPTWSTITVAQGGTTTFLTGKIFVDPKSVTANLKGKDYPLTIQSADRKKLVVKFPDDFPAGVWGTLPFTFKFGNWPAVVSNVPITVTTK